MSYNSATNCVDQISRLQIGVMLWTLYFKKTNNLIGWANPVSTFDDYEPDNEALSSRNIVLNEIQERNFHQQWNNPGAFGYTTQCDVDWVRFVAPCTGNFTVATSAMLNRAFANTRLTLYDNNLVQLAQNDDISPTNTFSSIQFNCIAGSEYFIRVENMNNLTTGYYTLQISRMLSITGDDAFCTTSNAYTIPNLPAGATVAWSVTPSAIAITNTPNAIQTSLNRSGNGIITLTATISNVCGAPIIINKNIAVGVPDRPRLLNELGNEIRSITACTNLHQSLCPTVNSLWDIEEWEWEKVTGDFNLIDFSSCAQVLGFTPGSGIVSVRVRNACGWSKPTLIAVNITDCNTAMKQNAIKLFPNPAVSSLTLAVDKAVQGKAENQKLPEATINEVRIYDSFGNIAIYRKCNKQQIVTINVGELRKGIYVVEVDTGNGKEYQQLVIQK